MEDCVHANPAAFLGESVEVAARQKRFGKFVPDLILKNAKGEVLIVEIQQRALDRYHLYKSLEYRDLVLAETEGLTVRIVLLCETMDERFRQLLRTHSIELIEIERKDFIATAVRETPAIVSFHLSNDTVEAPAKRDPDDVKLSFEPLRWGPRSGPSDVLAHLYKEFGRLGIDIDKIPRRYYHQVYWDVCNLLDEEFRRALEKIWLPDAWNYERLFEDSKSYKSAAHQKTLRKPRISISLHITQRGNLSVG
jgi:hypothetical protein